MMQQQSTRKYLLFKLIFSLLSVYITFMGDTQLAAANQTLPPGVVIGDEIGISASSEGEYYVDLPNVLPGESYEKTITIRSMDVKEPFELGILVEPEETKGVIDFDKHITLILSIDEKEIYRGPLLGNDTFDWKVQPLIIGTCEYGKDQILTAKFEVSKELDLTDYKEESQLLYRWTFVATKNQTKTSDSDSTLPKKVNKKPMGMFPMTGEEIKNLIYKLLTGLLLVLIVILLWKKRNEEQRNVD